MALLQKGDRFEDLEVAAVLESSGFTEAYRVKDSNGTQFRLEVIDQVRPPSTFFGNGGELRHLSIVKSVGHPAVSKLMKSGDSAIGRNRVAYQLYEFRSTESLAQMMLREATVPTYRVLPLMVSLLECLEAIHALSPPGVHNNINPTTVHRDLSGGENSIVLFGFDQARRISDPRDSVTRRNMSIFHTAPEVLNGVFIPQSDVYAVATLFHHLVVGVPPWFSEELADPKTPADFEELSKRRRSGLHFAFVDDDTLDDHQKNVLRKALSFEVGERFPSAADFMRALGREYVLASGGQSKPVVRQEVVEPTERKAGHGFDGIAGMENLKTLLREEVIGPIVERERYEKFGIPLLNGVLLYGPPGCGKTFIAEKLAEEVGFGFIKVNPSDLASPYVHGGKEKIGQLFKEAESNAPCLIFIDEIDAVIPSRDGQDVGHHYAGEVNEILAQMNNCGKRGIFIIGATNRPEKIDPAVLRSGRFDRQVYLPEPDKNAREEILRMELRNRPTDVSIDYSELGNLTAGYVSSDLTRLVNDSAKVALKNDSRITMEIIRSVIAETIPSVSRKQLDYYEDLNRRWTATRKGEETDRRRSIGFVSDEDN
jgi:transitional endoplasmic reticulum ATPase